LSRRIETEGNNRIVFGVCVRACADSKDDVKVGDKNLHVLIYIYINIRILGVMRENEYGTGVVHEGANVLVEKKSILYSLSHCRSI